MKYTIKYRTEYGIFLHTQEANTVTEAALIFTLDFASNLENELLEIIEVR